MTFQDLRLCPQILRAVKEQGYTEPTQIQQKAIPSLLAGNDLLGCARTGSGKTAAFALPILQRLYEKHGDTPEHGTVCCLILSPTRELSIQIYECFTQYGKYLPFRCGVITGGVNQKRQEQMLAEGAEILIATPGRLMDLMGQGILSLCDTEIFVLDEADRMLDMGFVVPVRRIAAAMPRHRQNIMFSATMPPQIAELAESLLGEYVRVNAHAVSSAAETIEQRLYYVDKRHKTDLLLEILADEKVEQALVFTRTKHGANMLVRELVSAGVMAMAIHGNKSQNARQLALSTFRDGGIRVLVATEIAARGIDVHDLMYVFNYNMPEEAEMYIHRIGRTGRAGMNGRAVSFCCADEKPLVAEIEKLMNRSIPVAQNMTYPATDSPTQKTGSRKAPGNQKSKPKESTPDSPRKKPGESMTDTTKPQQRKSFAHTADTRVQNHNGRAEPKDALPKQSHSANRQSTHRPGGRSRKRNSYLKHGKV